MDSVDIATIEEGIEEERKKLPLTGLTPVTAGGQCGARGRGMAVWWRHFAVALQLLSAVANALFPPPPAAESFAAW